MPTKIKICGITQIKTAQIFAKHPIDAIGLVFYDKSPRAVDIAQANKIIAALPPFVSRVGLFVNAQPDWISQVINEVGIDTLQFHGDESPEECAGYNLPFIKAIRVQPETDLAKLAQDYNKASGLLLDAYCKTEFGGTGEAFDWQLAQVDLPLPIILAGGLTPDNVDLAIQQVRPYAVDVSSGVELAKGVKDIAKIQAFLAKIDMSKRTAKIEI